MAPAAARDEYPVVVDVVLTRAASTHLQVERTRARGDTGAKRKKSVALVSSMISIAFCRRNLEVSNRGVPASPSEPETPCDCAADHRRAADYCARSMRKHARRRMPTTVGTPFRDPKPRNSLRGDE